MKRREFFTWVGAGALATSLPMVLAACNTNDSAADSASPAADSASPETATATTDSAEPADMAQAANYTPVGSVADLDAQGFLADEAFAAGPVMVIRDPGNTEALIAVDSRCTHQGCNVEWDSNDTTFVCPCHRSVFNPDGSVVSGPATAPLPNFEAIIDGDQVMVSAG
jgi:cytochrome b6-f complex iron-sulfur subunit